MRLSNTPKLAVMPLPFSRLPNSGTTVRLLAITLVLVFGFGARDARAAGDPGFSLGLSRNGQMVQQLHEGKVADFVENPDAEGLRRARLTRPTAPSAATVARNASLGEAAAAGEDLRRHADGWVRLHGATGLGADAEFGASAETFRAAQARAREALVALGGDLRERRLAPSIIERHEATLRQHDAWMARFDEAVTAAADGIPGAGERLHRLLAGSEFLREPTRSGEPTMATRAVDAPELSRAAADERIRPALPRAPAPRPGSRRVALQSAPKRVAAEGRTASALAGPVALQNSDPPSAPDLAATPDVQLTAEIIAQAAALGNSPLALYEFVRNHVAFEPYLGSRKGSAYTLRQLRGNDTDQASLLIALLRAAGVPARYARGTIELTPDQAKELTGTDDAAAAAGVLTTAGLDGVAIVDGPTVVAVRCTRVWVVAYVPYSNYRGATADDTGKTWIPLDPAYAAMDVTPGEDVLDAMGWDADAFLADYISTFHVPSVLEKLQADIQVWLDANQPGTTVADIERRLSVAPANLGLLPASLPYQVVSVDGEFATLEEAMRYKVRFHLHASGTTFINETLAVVDLAGHRLTIEYIGATPADQAVIDSYGSIYDTPPSLVDVKPVLKLDNTPVATSVNSIGMGIVHSSDMEFLEPTGGSNVQPTVENDIIAGNGQAIAFDTFLDTPDIALDTTVPASDVLIESVMHPTAAGYLSRVSEGLATAGRLLRVVTVQDVSEAIVENSVKVTYSGGGVPLTFEWTGLIVDADRRIIGPFAVDGDASKSLPYMKVTGYEGSLMENRIFEDTFDQDAVSTIKILELSNDAALGVCTITTSIAADCPGFSQSASIVSAVNAALAKGNHVTIPKAPITVGQWSGTGYIDLNPTTGAGGYIISGGISGNVTVSGGATVATWDISFTCEFDEFTGTVTTPPADSPDPSAVFCATDTNPLVLEGTVTVTCTEGGSQTKSLKPPFALPSPKAIADNPALGPGVYDVVLMALGQTKVLRKIAIAKVEFVTPDGDPVAAADQSGDGQNEFTYSGASPGVLTINLKAKVTPTGVAAALVNKVLFEVDDITGSAKAWAGANPNGKPTASGDNLLATVTFTTLPAGNGDFGTKEARVLCMGAQLDNAAYEVFFPRGAMNNPGGTDPNWFYYWRQVYDYADLVLDATLGGSGDAPGMTMWSYAAMADKDRIRLSPTAHPGKFKSYGVGEEYSGIDRYVATVVHEEKHIEQIALADTEVTATAGTPWRYGWSFNQGGNHNHWTVGPDTEPGDMGVDDDADTTIDNHITGGPGELGSGDDVDLTHPTTTSRNWPNSWPPPAAKIYASEIEDAAIKHSDAAVDEHDNAGSDWGDPGKQHKTINKWDD